MGFSGVGILLCPTKVTIKQNKGIGTWLCPQPEIERKIVDRQNRDKYVLFNGNWMEFSLLTKTHLIKYTEGRDGPRQLWVCSYNLGKKQTVLQCLWIPSVYRVLEKAPDPQEQRGFSCLP